MTSVSVGRKVPDFKLPATGNKEVKLSDFRGKNVIVYFYPKDNTSGCTREGEDFRDNMRKFRARNSVVLGVSRDSLKSHESFCKKYKFNFDLLADEDEKLCRQFDVVRQKSMYGRKFLGVERSTFLIDTTGVLRKEWRKVKVAGHVDDVLQALDEL